jgi:hypothetical protein
MSDNRNAARKRSPPENKAAVNFGEKNKMVAAGVESSRRFAMMRDQVSSFENLLTQFSDGRT